MSAVYSPEDLDKKEQSPGETKSPEDLASSEQNPEKHEDMLGSGYTSGVSQSKSRFRGLFRTRNRKIAAGAGIGAIIAGISIAAFLALLPLKILHIVNNLEKRFYATAENATQKESDRLFSNYMKRHVLPGLKNCKPPQTTVNKDCVIPISGDNLVQKLYRGWSQKRLEYGLAKDYGIEFSRTPDGNFHMKTRVSGNLDIDLKDFINSNDTLTEFIDKTDQFGGRNEFRTAVKQGLEDSFEGKTRYKRVMYRFKVGRLLEKKYGVKRCLIFCKASDKVSDWKDAKGRDLRKVSARIFMASRVLSPRTEVYLYIVQCVFEPKCDPTKIDQTTIDKYKASSGGCLEDCAVNGEGISHDEISLQDKLAQFVADDAITVEAMTKKYDEIQTKGWFGDMSEKGIAKTIEILTGVGDEKSREAAKKLKKLLPYIGLAYTAHIIINFVDEGGPKLQKFAYIANSTSAAQVFAMYRTHADEIKEGKVDSTMVGSFTDSLGPGNHSDNPDDDIIGGTSEAEGSPLYSDVLGENATNNGPVDGGTFLSADPQGPATPNKNNPYLCEDNNNKPVESGKNICDVEKVDQTSSVIDGLNAVRASSFFGILRVIDKAALAPLSKAIDALISLITDPLSKFLGPLIDLAVKVIEGILKALGVMGILKDVAGAIVQHILPPSPVSSNMSGGRTFDMMTAGADVSGNDFAHHGLGGVVLNGKQQAMILQQQRYQDDYQYRNQSFFARMFDTESNRSLVTKLAMAMPTHPASSAMNSYADFIASPLKRLASMFNFMFGFMTAKVGAVTTGTLDAPADVFGVTQYGYPLDDPYVKKAFAADPEVYWDKYCVSTSPSYITKNWDEDAIAVEHVNKLTQMPENLPKSQGGAGVNPCLLIQSTVASAGALFTSDVLSPEDLGSSSSPNPGSGDAGGGTCEQDAGVPDIWVDAIIKAAPPIGDTCRGKVPPNAVPNDGQHDYFASYALFDPHLPLSELPNCSFDANRHCIQVKYRDPPGTGNTIEVPVD